MLRPQPANEATKPRASRTCAKNCATGVTPFFPQSGTTSRGQLKRGVAFGSKQNVASKHIHGTEVLT